jgi:hypothetical protein
MEIVQTLHKRSVSKTASALVSQWSQTPHRTYIHKSYIIIIRLIKLNREAGLHP